MKNIKKGRCKKDTRNFAEKAYKSTRIDYGHTQSQITEMLAQIGITNIRVTQVANDYSFDFIAKLKHEESPRKVRMTIPINTDLDDTKRPINVKRRKDAIFRILLWTLKSRFVGISNGLMTFEEAFLGDLLIIHNGKEQRIADILTPMIKSQLKDSDKVILKIAQGA